MLVNDRLITISQAGTRKATRWPAQSLMWSELVAKLSTPIRGSETLNDYLAMPKSRQDDLKDVGGFVAGSLAGERRKASAVTGRDVITLDLDNIPTGGTTETLQRVHSLGCGYAVYSTRKHYEAKPRLRILVPLSRTVTAEEYEAVSRKLASFVGLELCDPSTFEPSRLMYWPSCCADSQYIYTYADMPFLDADGMLALYQDWRDLNEWPQVPGAQPNYARLAARQGEPTEKPGLVGAFCKVYDIYAAMEKFIPGAYISTDTQDRLTYVGGSTAGGAVVYDDGKFLYSHHATDPTSGRLVNAFDLVRLHLFNDKDDDAKPDTPVNKMPSYQAMQELAVNDKEVTTHMAADRYAKATEDFAVEGQPSPAVEDSTWLSRLTINPNTGKVALTIDNAVIVLENDPQLKNKFIYDDFSARALVTGALPWDPREEYRWHNNNDDAGIRRYLEKVYGISGKDRINDALSQVIYKYKFNAVQDYLTALKWDGVRRVDTLFIDYLGAEDSDYTRAVTRKSLVAAVTRAMQPGAKHDPMLILVGPQGRGKSTCIRHLGKNWFNESLISFEGKDAQELIQGSWILELGELDALSRSELTTIKNFLSKCEDIYRGAYKPLPEKYPRRCVFFGTTNTDDFIKDSTGGRRYWPVKTSINEPVKSVFHELQGEVDQIWAEAYLYWQFGEPLHLSRELEALAKEQQEKYTETSAKEGTIREFVERLVPKNWDTFTLGQRRMHWSGDFNDDSKNKDLVPRDRICAAEIYVECLNGELRYMKRQDTSEINAIISKLPGWIKSENPLRFGCHGQQRGFRRDSGVT